MQQNWYIVAGLAVIALQTAGLATLLFERQRRRVAERSVMQDIARMRKDAEFLAREISSKLITAQEDERKRLARDLHDDLNQRLAMLSVQLELLDQKVFAEEAHGHVHEISDRVKELASQVHRLSFGLRPAKLDQLGLITAARSLCRDLAQETCVEIHFAHNQIRRDVDATLALTLYRVLQESLQNAVRHSGAPQVRVNLTADGDQIRLIITDDGRGFDPLHATCGGGLGFVSMRERMRQVNGAFNVDSAPGRGTRVEACAPLMFASPIDN